MTAPRWPIIVLTLTLGGLVAAPPVPVAPEIIAELRGHEETVYSVAASPEAKLLATASFDKSLKLWSQDGKLLRSYVGKSGHTNQVISVAFSKGKVTRLASGSTDNTVKLWELPLSVPLDQRELPAAGSAVAVSPDGKWNAAGTETGSIQVWSTSDPKQTRLLEKHAGPVRHLLFAANSQSLYSVGSDHHLKAWNLLDGKLLGSVGVSLTDVSLLALNPANGQLLTVNAEGIINSWPSSFPVVKEHPGLKQEPILAVPSADGNTLALVAADQSVSTVNTLTGVAGPALPKFTGEFAGLAISANGSLIARSTREGSVEVVGSDGKPRGTLEVDTIAPSTLSFLPGNSSLVTATQDGFLQLWPSIPAPSLMVDHPAIVTSVALHSDGTRWLTGGTDGSFRVISQGKIEKTFTGQKAEISAVLETAGTYFSADIDGTLLTWSSAKPEPVPVLQGGPKQSIDRILVQGPSLATLTRSGQVTWYQKFAAKAEDADAKPLTLSHPEPVRALALTTDGKSAITLDAKGTRRIWTLPEGKVQKEESLGVTAVSLAQFSADQKNLLLVTGAPGEETLQFGPAILGTPPLWQVKLTGKATRLTLNGNRAAVAMSLGTSSRVTVYDLATGAELERAHVRSSAIRAVALSSDSKSLVLAGDEKKLILKPLVVAVSHHVGMGNANVMTVHPSNGQVITAGTDKIVRIWDPTTKKEIKVLEPLPAIPTHLVISQDGTRLAASAGKLLRVWSVSDSKNFSQSEQHASIIALRFTNDPSRVLIGFADRRSARYNLEKQSVEEWITNPADVLAVVQHPQQPQSALSISKGKTVTTLPLIALKTQRDEKNQGKILMITPNGSHLLTAGKGEGPVALNASSLGAERTFALKGAITAVAVTKNVQVLAAAMADPPRIALYQFGSGQEIGSFPLPEAVSELQFHPTQLVLFGRSSPNTLTAWDVSFENGQPIGPDFGKAIQQFPHSTPLRGLTLSAKGDQLLTVSTDRLVRHWGFASLTPSASLGHPNRIDSLAFHPTEPMLATGCADGIIRVWDLSIPQPTTKKTITAHQRTNPNEQFPIYAVKWSPDGKRLASGSLDKSIKVWDAESTKLIFEIKPGSDLPPLLESTRQAAPALASTAAAYLWKEARPEGHTDAVYTLDYSPDGKLLASGSSDHMIKIWNAETGTLLRSLTNPQVEDNGFGTRPAHPAFVHKLAFNSQGNRLVSVGPAPGNNGFLAIWNPLDGTILKQTALRIGQIHGVAWTSDSQLLLGCGPQSRTQLESAAYVLPYKE